MHKKVFSYLWTSASLLEKVAFYKELILSLYSVEPILLCLKLYCKTPSSSWLLHTSLKHHHNSCQNLYDKILQDTVTFLQFTTFWLPFLWFSTHVQQNVLQNLPHFASISLILYTCTTEFAFFFLDTIQIQHSTSSPVLHPQYYCIVRWLELEFPKWLFLLQFCPQHGHTIRQFFNNIQGMEAVISYHFATKPPSVSWFQETQLLHIPCSFLQYWKKNCPKTKHKTLELKLMSKKAYCKTPFRFLTSPPLPKPTQCFNPVKRY